MQLQVQNRHRFLFPKALNVPKTIVSITIVDSSN